MFELRDGWWYLGGEKRFPAIAGGAAEEGDPGQGGGRGIQDVKWIPPGTGWLGTDPARVKKGGLARYDAGENTYAPLDVSDGAATTGVPAPTAASLPATDPWQQLYSQYGFGSGTGGTGGTGTSAGGTGTAATGGSNVIQKLLDASSQDIPYLRSTNLSQTPEGQAIFESVAHPIRTQFDIARQRLTDTLGARQGFSGVLAEQLAHLDEQENEQLSNVGRQFLGETRSRLGESRQALTDLVGLQEQLSSAALAKRMAVDEAQRQRLFDTLAVLNPGMTIPAQSAQTSGNLLNYAGNLAQSARAQQAASNQGLGNLMQLYWLTQRPSQTTTPQGGGGGSSATIE